MKGLRGFVVLVLRYLYTTLEVTKVGGLRRQEGGSSILVDAPLDRLFKPKEVKLQCSGAQKRLMDRRRNG